MNIGDRVRLVDYPGLLAEVTGMLDHTFIIRLTQKDAVKFQVHDLMIQAPDYQTHCYTQILSYKVLPLSKLERVLR